MKNIIITGGTGLIGKALTEELVKAGYLVNILSRKPRKSSDPAIEYSVWDPGKEELPEQALNKADVVINLAGANVSDKRWSKKFKEQILKSRTETTRLLVNFYNSRPELPLKTFIQASAIGYYGYDSADVHTEEDMPANDFMASVCRKWEAEAQKLRQNASRRLLISRTGIVFSGDGGALMELAKPIKYGAGAVLGSGKQFMNWIHIYDLCKMLQFLMENESCQGVYNAVAPNPATLEEVTAGIAKRLRKPLILPNVPAFALKLIVGEFAAALLGSSFVSSEKIKSSGFSFCYPKLSYALDDLLKD